MTLLDEQQIWKTALAQIEIKLDSPAHFKTWFQPTELIEVKGNIAVVGVKNSYTIDWLKKKHNNLVIDTLSHILKKQLDIEYVISKSLINKNVEKTTKEELSATPLLSIKNGEDLSFGDLLDQSNLNSFFSFETFITGPSNRLAHAAAQAVVADPGKIYNPLFVYGKTGLGKTHISQAIGRKLLEKNQGKKVLYIPSETFLNEMVAAIKTGKTKAFRNKYRFLDLLIIDDIQLISKWEQTQDELFNTFNALQNKSKQVILISDRSPEEIHNLEARLLSRFQGGMVVQVEKPDFETRLAILEEKMKSSGIFLPKDVIEFIAENITENIRKLEGSLHQIALYNNVHTSQITVQEVAALLGKDTRTKREKIKPIDVIKATAKEFQVSSKDILSSTRKAEIAFARQVVMYLLREEFKYKLEQIAEFLNRKDHTTVIHAVDKIKSKIQLESGFEEQIQQIKKGFLY